MNNPKRIIDLDLLMTLSSRINRQLKFFKRCAWKHAHEQKQNFINKNDHKREILTHFVDDEKSPFVLLQERSIAHRNVVRRNDYWHRTAKQAIIIDNTNDERNENKTNIKELLVSFHLWWRDRRRTLLCLLLCRTLHLLFYNIRLQTTKKATVLLNKAYPAPLLNSVNLARRTARSLGLPWYKITWQFNKNNIRLWFEAAREERENRANNEKMIYRNLWRKLFELVDPVLKRRERRDDEERAFHVLLPQMREKCDRDNRFALRVQSRIERQTDTNANTNSETRPDDDPTEERVRRQWKSTSLYVKFVPKRLLTKPISSAKMPLTPFSNSEMSLRCDASARQTRTEQRWNEARKENRARAVPIDSNHLIAAQTAAGDERRLRFASQRYAFDVLWHGARRFALRNKIRKRNEESRQRDDVFRNWRSIDGATNGAKTYDSRRQRSGTALAGGVVFVYDLVSVFRQHAAEKLWIRRRLLEQIRQLLCVFTQQRVWREWIYEQRMQQKI